MSFRWRMAGFQEFMAKQGMRRTFPLIFGLLLTAMSLPVFAVEVVCNKSIPISQISRLELQAFFTMRLRAWPDGVPTHVFVLPDNAPAHNEFSKRVLDMFPYQLRRYWDRLVFSGTGQAPTELSSLAEMRERIATTPGSIGYLPSDLVDHEVRVVKVSSQ
jgi:hypothetical protein